MTRPKIGSRRPAGAESPGDASPNAVAEVRADRLNDALTRLRAGTEPIDPLPAPAGSVTPVALTPALRR